MPNELHCDLVGYHDLVCRHSSPGGTSLFHYSLDYLEVARATVVSFISGKRTVGDDIVRRSIGTRDFVAIGHRRHYYIRVHTPWVYMA
jgi:hypothetical protein